MKVIQLHKTTTSLIKKAIKQNREAQQMLFDAHAPKMLSVCRYYVNDYQKAEEIMLNGFLKAFTHLNQFQNSGSFEGWLRKIMVREAISYLRKLKKIEFPVADIESNQNQAHYNNVHSNMDVAHIQELIDRLPDGYKIVFVMYAIEGYKHHEIAALLKISEGTSKSQLYKARKQLQKQINALNTRHYESK
ncbi:RNA polymerase sigma factor [Bizionia sediminis]|uniref:RNA polymerase sigma factor n=1 Tax=Bizionia sediminis TaxID=1737064 RepID=A0ABW5KWR3_9FLAO